MRLRYTLLLTLLAVGSHAAHADGQSDLKSALQRLQAVTPLKATLDTRTLHRNGEGKDVIETSGHASVAIEDSARGLQLSYGTEMLARMDAEALALARNPNAKAPTLTAAREFSPNELRPMIAAAGTLARTLERAVFKAEKADTYQGKPARLLSYEIGVETLSERERKYVKDFDGRLSVWIAADGTPLASRITQNAHGRAFVVVSFDAKADEQNVYGVAGERLVTLRQEINNSSGGMGERGEQKVIKTLQL
ncbi:MAG: hypothetical protein ACEQSK_03300 [Sphingomonadaceae bacterium]